MRLYVILAVSKGNGELVFSKPYEGNTLDKKMDKEAIEFICSRMDFSLYTIVADLNITILNLIGDLIKRTSDSF